MYHRGMKWEEYLEHQGFKDDIVRGLERQSRELMSGQQQVVQQAVNAQTETTLTLERGFGQMIASQEIMTDVMQNGFSALSYSLERVSGGIAKLNAQFNWAMSAVLWKLEVQNKALDKILTTLQAPLDTQAKELRRRAEDAYLNGWYPEALQDFLESEKKNYQDFAVHQAIANIYLYKQQPADLEKARQYYLNAGKYAAPRSTYHAALGYMHAAFVCYLQGDDAAAIENAQRATELHPQLTEAFYNHAKFAASAGQPSRAIPSLETAIRTDRNYAIKAFADTDFARIEEDVAELIERLRTEAREKVNAIWLPLRTDLNRHEIPSDEKGSQVKKLWQEIEALMAQDTYFGYLDAPRQIPQCQQLFNALRLPDRDRLQDEATASLTSFKKKIENRAKDNLLQKRLDGELAAIDRLLAGVPTYSEALAARDKVNEYVQNTVIGGEKKATLRGHKETVNVAVFSPAGNWLASASDDHTVRLWDPITGREQAVLSGHAGKVETIAFSPDGSMLASGSYDGSVRLWNLNTGREQTVLSGHAKGVGTIAFNPDGSMLASGSYDGSVRLWETFTGSEKAMLIGHTKGISTVAFSPDGHTLASASYDGTVRLWETQTGRERAVLNGHTESVGTITFNPAGSILASASDDSTIRLWDVDNGRERAVLSGHSSWVRIIAFSPNGKTLASGAPGTTDRAVRLWDIQSGQQNAVLGHARCVYSIAFCPDGDMLVSGAENGTVHLWESGTGNNLAVLGSHAGCLNTVTFSPDGGLVASGGSEGEVSLWRVVWVHKADVMRREREQEVQSQKEVEQWRKESKESHERMLMEREKKQQEAWLLAGCCIRCGEKLGAVDKMRGKKTCKQHRLWE